MMFQLRFPRSCRRFLSFLAIFSLSFFIVTGAFAGLPLPVSIKKAALMPGPDSYPAIYEKPKPFFADEVCLFALHDGDCKPHFFSRAELLEGHPLKIDGYVMGVVVFGPKDLKVQLGDHSFRPLHAGADGTFTVKDYGKLKTADLSARPDSVHSAAEPQTPPTDPPAVPPIPSAYYYFPKVYGETVSPQPRFELQLTEGDARQTVQIEHRSIQTIHMGDDERNIPTTFHYLGDRLNVLLNHPGDFRARLVAIGEGIKEVDDAFHLDLVHRVQLIDLNGKNNALTYNGPRTVWFYVDTVMGTSIKELRNIACHEALHQLVYRTRLAHQAPIRRFFADLWGLDDFSVARFQMVTTGWFDSQSTYLPHSGGLFFAFINEKNFQKGMHGGHSQDNIDEFLTSFFHSLLNIDRLGPDLEKPVNMNGVRPWQLKEADRSRLLVLYKKSIDLLLQAVESPSGPTGQEKMTLDRFLKNRLAMVDKIHLTSTPKGA